MKFVHIPAMVDESIHYLGCAPGKIYVDCTLGGSSHAQAILEKIIPGGLLVGIDQDPAALENAAVKLKPFQSNIQLFHDNYVHLPEILSEAGIEAVDGIFLDLGLSLYQLTSSGRGFSFKREEPLDMRMNPEISRTAAHIVNQLPERELANVFYEYGEEKMSRRIARRIGVERSKKKIETSLELAGIVASAIGAKKSGKSKIHPATRVFMALRIAVNGELDVLKEMMGGFMDLLNPGGRICVLSYHSLEDRIVKQAIKALEKGCDCPSGFPICVCGKKATARNLTRKPQRPSEKEVAENPMARSALLRAAEKL